MSEDEIVRFAETLGFCNESELNRMVDSRDCRKKIALWGAGRVGRKVRRFLEKKGIAVDCFADDEPETVGEDIQNDKSVEVVSVSKIRNRAEEFNVLIAVSAFDEILKTLRKPGFEDLFTAVRGIANGDWLEIRTGDIDRGGKVVLPYIDIVAVKQCNLKCMYCQCLSPFRKGIVSPDEMAECWRIWSKKLAPGEVHFSVGETLLHSDVESVVRLARRYWTNQTIVLFTNGLLLENIQPSLWKTLQETETMIEISVHYFDNRYEKQLERGIQKVEENEIRYKLRDSRSEWRRWNRYDERNCPVPSFSEPQNAFDRCENKRCPLIDGDRLHRCNMLFSAKQAWEEGVLDERWSFLETEPLLDANCSVEHISEHLNSGPFAACKMCSDQQEFCTKLK